MILVTGGAGYIGSHVCLALLEAGHAVAAVDNLSNSSVEAIRRVERIAGRAIQFSQMDVRDRAALETLMRGAGIEAVIHLAGLKSVAESVEKPLEYFDCNVAGAASLIAAMATCGVRTIVLSSSATVYGVPRALPIPEGHDLHPVSPYGRTKLAIEEMLRGLPPVDPRWRVGVLRYFNPVGAHASGLIGEDPVGTPNNLLPFVAQVAVGNRPELTIWGDNYATADGTGVRDYVHVTDIAEGHVAALAALQRGDSFTVNLGTGTGHSVREVVTAFEAASGRQIPFRVGPRRDGDVASCYAEASLAAEILGWRATRGLSQMCADHWRWQNANPLGYRDGVG